MNPELSTDGALQTTLKKCVFRVFSAEQLTAVILLLALALDGFHEILQRISVKDKLAKALTG